MSRYAIVASMVLVWGCPRSSQIADGGTDPDALDANGSLEEDLQLAVDGMEAQARIIERVCNCGFFCGNVTRITTEQAGCFFAQAAGDVETYRFYFEAVTEYSRRVEECYDDMGCVEPSTCTLVPPEIVRTPPAFYVRALSVCV